jgi:eukaryotic-like serine/threonine-protein kinase
VNSASDRAERIAELAKSAAEQPPHARASFIALACDGDARLRAEVESLLQHHRDTTGVFDHGAVHLVADSLSAGATLKPNEQIESYTILSRIGSGGMGDVYLAEDTRLRRKVALKLVRTGIGRDEIIGRFRYEEQILASLNHPNIAQLHGCGTTPNGTPFFVMEYVDGAPLTEFCQTRELTIEQRLQVFRKVCAAVEYAHRHLVVHRDLKPSNILVTRAGEPKLLDFGIAKLLEGDELALARAVTITLLGVMTPEYASPEQVRGEPISTATDVYSLGVILYELLTEQRLYSTKSRRPDELARAVTDEEPQRPSTAAAANRHARTPPGKSLRGDLDNIVLMALRKEPERRYASVAQLSEDIRRHLEGLPVTARKDTWGYRTSKFVRRHKPSVIAGAITLLALIGGIVIATWQARVARAERANAERRFNDVRKLANSYLFEFHDAIENLPGSTPVRALLVKRALEYLDSLAAESSHDLTLRREVAMAYLKVGNVQGNPRNANLGDSAGALASYDKALALASSWPVVRGDNATRRPIALIFEKMADVLTETDRIAEGVQKARESLTIFREIADAKPGDAGAQLSVAISHLKLGDYLGNPNFPNAGDQEGAMESYRAALQLFDRLHAAEPQDVRHRRFLGVIHERLGAMYQLRNDLDRALAEYQQSAEIRRPLAAEFPNDSNVVRDGAIAEEKVANILSARGDVAAALAHGVESLRQFQHLAAADPTNVDAQRSVAISHLHLGRLFVAAARADEARANFSRALAILEPLAAAETTAGKARNALAEAREELKGLPQ